MKIWKRNAVVAAIVLFVCVAVYLNWSYDQTESVSGSTSEAVAEKTLGETELVSAQEELTLEDSVDTASGESEEEDALSEHALTEEDTAQTAAEASDYFDTARLNREEARDSALSILQETVDDPSADSEAVNTAAESITAMAAATLAESQIESLVTAKGYADCVAFIGDSSVSVVVSTENGELEASDIAKITDIVCGETEFSASDVKVITAE
ncbi:MAG: SpoIIIAH-like family protein [Clostridiales bacterium]|nr:SpoIIIAH-like family protein [Clostridiales bacterium]MCD8141855.1 SpoIIIAH-like family protein [Clostridiales bacterium]